MQGVQRTCNLQYSFFKKAQGSRDADGGAGETCKIVIPAVHARQEGEHELLQQAIKQHDVPQALRSALQSGYLVSHFASLT